MASNYHWFRGPIDLLNVDQDMTCNRSHNGNHYMAKHGVVKRISTDSYLVCIVNEFGRSCEEYDSVRTIYKVNVQEKDVYVDWYTVMSETSPDDDLSFNIEDEKETIFNGYTVHIDKPKSYHECNKQMKSEFNDILSLHKRYFSEN